MSQIIPRDTEDSRIRGLYQQLDQFFLRNGFVEEDINGEINFIKGDLYCVPICVDGLGVLIDYADTREDAQNHLHTGGDYVPLSVSDEVILKELKAEILDEMKSYHLDICVSS